MSYEGQSCQQDANNVEINPASFLGSVSNQSYPVDSCQERDRMILRLVENKIKASSALQSLSAAQEGELDSLLSVVEGISSSIPNLEQFQEYLLKKGAFFMHCTDNVGVDILSSSLKTYENINDKGAVHLKGGEFLENTLDAYFLKDADKAVIYRTLHDYDDMTQLLVAAYEINNKMKKGMELQDAVAEVRRCADHFLGVNFEDDDTSYSFVGSVLKNYLERLKKEGPVTLQ